ncbi:hypothetical protein U1839_06110 [Sphingomonas sp. RT2P30]|uniref:hypothetical protein n=1 Tax=Parasphingomonas halimpatiens TaxID=3096162 RepID=UPI002FC72307
MADETTPAAPAPASADAPVTPPAPPIADGPAMRVRMLTSMAGPDISMSVGDIYECDQAEAIRLIEAGFAAPEADAPKERAVKKGPAETR